MNRFLVVVDMQVDFVDGALGTPEAVAIVPAVAEKIRAFDGTVLVTLDTHGPDYLATQEGMKLPVAHCVRGTDGHRLIPQLAALDAVKAAKVFEKPGFGSLELARYLAEAHKAVPIGEIELVGLCTDICVVSNALLLKAFLPETPIFVDPACCAGVTPERHRAALETMASCQIGLRAERGFA